MEPWMLLVLLPAAWVMFSFYRGYRSPAQLRTMAEDLSVGGALIDVRTPAEFSGGHHRRARNIPLGDLRGRLEELDPDLPVVVYCRSGSRSHQARSILVSAGYARVHDLGPLRNVARLPEVDRAKRAPLTRNQRKRERQRLRKRQGGVRS